MLTRQSWPSLLIFVFGVIAGGFVVGSLSPPGEWLARLDKPEPLPPDWLSGLMWFLLCIAFGIAGWRLWQVDSTSVETRLWLATLILSWWYSPLFFVIRSPPLALVVIAALGVLMLVFVFRTWHRDRVSAWLFLPCLAWVAYATSITAAIVVMNP